MSNTNTITTTEPLSICLDLRDAAVALDTASFPNFLVDSRTAEAFIYLANAYSELVLVTHDDNNVLSTAFSAPVYLDNEGVLEKGWEEMIGIALVGGNSNTLFIYSLSVSSAARGLGLGGKMVEETKSLARNHGYTKIITPVRPTGIAKYPNLTVDQYAHLVDDRTGHSFDPWVATLQRHGGEIAGVGVDSHVIKSDDGNWPSVAQWEAWTGMQFAHDGEYDIPGGCAKLKIHDGVGEYREDCIWVSIEV